MQKIGIKTDVIKLNSFLKLADLTDSGGQAKALIKDGEVQVNGEVCTVVRKQLHKGDIVRVGASEVEIV